MYTIDIRLKADEWRKDTFDVEDDILLIVHLQALQAIRRRLGKRQMELLPLGNMEYVIWGDRVCQGFLGIVYNGPLSSDVQELDEI